MAWGLCYAGDLAAFTAASVYAYHAGGAGLVGILGLARGVPAALLVLLVTSWSDRVRRERLLIATVVPRALIPWLARTPDELTSANTAASVIQSAAMVAGPAIAAGLLAIGAPQSAMFVACGLVAVGAVLLAGVRPLSSEAPLQVAGRLKQLKLDMAAGFEAGIRRPGALALVVPAAAQTFARGVLNVLAVVIALDLFGLGRL